jgi:cytochrome c-type biogenesis protein CcsB
MSDFLETLLRQNHMFLGAMALYLLAMVLYGAALARPHAERWLQVAALTFATASALVVAFIALRWIEAGRPPFKSLYESLVLFTCCMSLLYMGIERYYRIAWLGAATGLFAFLVMGYGVAKADAEIINLPAALQSVWFVPHVVVYFFGYAAVFMAFVAALLHLWRPDTVLTLRTTSGSATTMTYAGFMHRTILLGFVLLTAGLVIGAIWAKTAWGDYWVWDPKENWALVSWLVFAIYLHLRLTKGFSERAAAILTVFGFATIAFTYLGMHLLPTAEQSVHLYQ